MPLAASSILIFLGPQPAERLGVFDRSSIVLAYCRSTLWMSQVRAKRERMEAARRAGDRRTASELDPWGREARRLADRQLAGRAPIDNLLLALQARLAGIASRAGVTHVVLKTPPGVETVDVTPLPLDVMRADAATREMVEKLRRRQGRRSTNRRKE